MSPPFSRNFGTFGKKSVKRVVVITPDVEAQNLDGNNETVMQTIEEIEEDPETKNRVKSAVKKIQDTLGKQTPEQRAKMLNSLPTLDGATYTQQEMEQAYQDGKYSKKKSRARHVGRAAVGVLAGIAAGVGITGVVLAIFFGGGIAVCVPMVGGPLLVVILLIPIGMAIEAAAREREHYCLPGKTSSDEHHEPGAPPPRNTSS